MAQTIRRRDRVRASPDAMTLFEHLGELRRRLIICIIVFVAGAVVCYLGYVDILDVLRRPLCEVKPHDCQLFFTEPLQGFATRLNISAYGGLVIALPAILYELWQFVTPGLKASERRYTLPFVFATMLLFALGAFIAYAIFPKGLNFLLHSAGAGTTPLLTVQAYVGLITLLMMVFGVAFEFPAVLVALELAGVLSTAALRRFRRFAIIIITIFSAVATPSSDPFSMLALAIPLLVFYEGAIVVGRLCHK
jgi:sec-independent protein translocase protein TatC